MNRSSWNGGNALTSQEKKLYLQKYKIADRHIDDMLRQKDDMMTRLTKMTATLTGMPRGGGGSDTMTAGVAKLIDLDNEIDRQVDALVDMRREIEGHINSISDDRYKRLLTLRYLDGMTWDRVGLEMGYERRQVTRLHGFALMDIKIPDANACP